ncbi:MAG: alpha/beta hydrolase, partial [Ignavibacteria bacterium]|nr:alpha/beta hydrolase [Ignavibacteria bacterium]
ASIAFWNRYTQRQVESWKQLGYLEVINTRTNQVMRLNKILLEDFENNKERFDLLKRISNLKIPLLIVHGTQDMTVPLSEARALYSASNKENSELFIVENTGHTFGAVHPFTGTNPSLEMAIDKTLNFFKRNL